MNIWQRVAIATSVILGFAACAAPELETEGKKSSNSKLESSWSPPSSDATGTYEGLKSGEKCAGGLKPGTEQLGEQVKAKFGVSYGGYSCRANTANTKELSIHAVGRALDVMVGQGSTKGNDVANYFVENAMTLGIDLIIWNHTLWKVTPSGATSRAYTGPNPHTDHVHAEVNSATAANGPGTVSDDGSATTDPNADTTDPNSTDPNATDPTDPNAPTDPNDPNAATDPNDPNAATDPNDPYADDQYGSEDDYGYDPYADGDDFGDGSDDYFQCDDEGYCW